MAESQTAQQRSLHRLTFFRPVKTCSLYRFKFVTDNVLPDWLPTTSVQEHQDCSGPDCPDKTFCSEQNCAGQDILFRTKLSWTRHTVQNQTVQNQTPSRTRHTVRNQTRHTVQNQTVQDKTYCSEPDCPGQDILFRTRLSKTRHTVQNQTVQGKTYC